MDPGDGVELMYINLLRVVRSVVLQMKMVPVSTALLGSDRRDQATTSFPQQRPPVHHRQVLPEPYP